VRGETAGQQKTRREAGFVESKNVRDDYPAGWNGSGRRAREVMPAAMRALVRTKALKRKSFMGRG